MDISVVSGKGEAQTLLSAFDAALKDCGMHNYNLIYLSSIIPPGANITQIDRFEPNKEHYGHKAYVIKAEERSAVKRTALGAGLGWYQLEDNRGFFVEHHTRADTEEKAREILESRITQSLQDLATFRDVPFNQGKISSIMSTSVVGDKPACVLTLAVYEAEGWSQ